MKLTTTEFNFFRMYVNHGLKIRGKSFGDVKTWIQSIGDEKLSHFNCLTAVHLAKLTPEGWNFVYARDLKDSHWATIGRKYFKEFK